MKEKITKEYLEKKYNELCKKADDLHKKYNPCGIKKRGDKFTCIAGRDGKNTCQQNLNASFCCYGCKYLSEAGCQAEALRCKLWFCGYLYDKGLDLVLKKEMNDILKEAWEYGFLIFRGSKEDNLYNAYYKFGLLRSLRFDWIQ